ncbi:CRISPR-associated endonuclease Cas2 [Persephonella atlantica]|uniref:CRISPR-associated endoribonuclease Cas2 n=1 Tax=Persephonella atlantica TaxID=2699429 RepID=A0ABS1GIA6_9AQUI|nr:CRISPR-associated endonuclease Cas2 [Persephonella atlantica]MBK3332638.1 CRISPR-associated endonuclease Cas2 [Persephonella atlantica]
MRFIICYDISDDKKRNKVSKLLKAYGIRTQLSLFEVEADKETIINLLNEVEKEIDEIDKFFIYPVDNEKKIIRMGIAKNGALTFVI